MQPKAKSFRYRATSSRALFESRSCLVILAVNWLFQGMRGMDTKELGFRLGLLLLVSGLVTLLAVQLLALALPTAAVLGLAIGHSVNFLCNGQLWVLLRYCPGYCADPARLARATARLIDDVAAQDWLDEAVLIGSTVTRLEAPKSRADIDLRLIFPSGPAGWLRTNLYLLRLRSLAALRAVPLDVYAYEHPAVLRRFDQNEPLGIILDRGGRLVRGFAHRRVLPLR